MSMRAARVRSGEWIVFGASVALLIAMLVLNWDDVPSPGGQGVIKTPVDGWHALPVVRWFMLASIVCGLALAATQALSRAPAVPATLSLLSMLLGAITAVALLVRVLIDPPDGVKVGGVLGLLSAGAVTWGGFRSMRQEGIAEQDAPDVESVDPFAPPPLPGPS